MPAATLQISFSDRVTRVLIELEAGRSFDNTIPFWVFPSNPDVVEVTVGSREFTGNRTIEVRGEIIKFEKTDKAQLKYPGVETATVSSFPGAIFRSSDGSPVSPKWSFDKLAGEIIALDPQTNAPVNIYGGAAVDYSVRYSRYLYTPSSETLNFNGVRNQYGSIIAIKNEAVDTLEIDPGVNTNAQYAELYHVYSYVVIANSDTEIRDVWEKPPNYPTDGEFPISADGPDPDNSVAVERVHEIGYVNKAGFEKDERFIHPKEKPYQGAGDAFYTPEYKLKFQSPPAGYEEAFGKVDQSAIREDLSGRYPGIST